MKILVTGSTGFIGRLLVERLVCQGEHLNLLCRPQSDLSGLNSANSKIVYGDISDPDSLERAVSDCDRIFHIAAYAKNWARNPATFYDINVRGLINVLNAAEKMHLKRVVFTSSSVSFGPSNGTPVTETTVRKTPFLTEYEQSKYLAEQNIQEYLNRGLEVVIVNPTRVFGPGLMTEGNSVTRMIGMYLNGRFRTLPGNGSRIGNYAFVDDVVSGHIFAMEKGKTGSRYILGGENLSYNGFFGLVSEIADTKRWMVHIPPPVALAYSHIENYRACRSSHYPLITPGWVRTFLADWAFSSVRAHDELGYTITPIRTALSLTIQWLKDRDRIEKGVSR